MKLVKTKSSSLGSMKSQDVVTCFLESSHSHSYHIIGYPPWQSLLVGTAGLYSVRLAQLEAGVPRSPHGGLSMWGWGPSSRA